MENGMGSVRGRLTAYENEQHDAAALPLSLGAIGIAPVSMAVNCNTVLDCSSKAASRPATAALSSVEEAKRSSIANTRAKSARLASSFDKSSFSASTTRVSARASCSSLAKSRRRLSFAFDCSVAEAGEGLFAAGGGPSAEGSLAASPALLATGGGEGAGVVGTATVSRPMSCLASVAPVEVSTFAGAAGIFPPLRAARAARSSGEGALIRFGYQPSTTCWNITMEPPQKRKNPHSTHGIV